MPASKRTTHGRIDVARYFLDENPSARIGRLLRAEGHDVGSARERGWSRVPDYRIFTVALAEQRTLLTKT